MLSIIRPLLFRVGKGKDSSSEGRSLIKTALQQHRIHRTPLVVLSVAPVLGMVKSLYVCPENSRGGRRKWRATPLPAEVAGQLFHAQFHECQCVRRHAPGGRWCDGDRRESADRSTSGRYGGLVPAQELHCKGERIVPIANGVGLLIVVQQGINIDR